MNGYVTNFAARLQQLKNPPVDAPRRTTHGSSAWTLPFGTATLRQPQDGARLKQLSPNATPATDDDRLSGATRSLSNRVLGLNVFAGRRPQLEAEPERYFAEPLRLPKPEPLRKTAEFIRQVHVQANVA